MNNCNNEDYRTAQTRMEIFKNLGEENWTCIHTVIDVVREPVIILDTDLRVIMANEPFYRTFQVASEDTEGKILYTLGNGQWNIPALRKLLENILPQNTFFKGFEVTHEFPVIGRKMMILNARQVHSIILLAMEDVTEILAVAETLAEHANRLEAKIAERTKNLQKHIGTLEQEIDELKKKPYVA